MVNNAKELGKRIGKLEKNQKKLEQNLRPTQQNTGLILNYSDTLQLDEETNIYKFELCDDAFVLDHPTQGKLDDANLKLDHGYCGVTKIQRETDYELLGV